MRKQDQKLVDVLTEAGCKGITESGEGQWTFFLNDWTYQAQIVDDGLHIVDVEEPTFYITIGQAFDIDGQCLGEALRAILG